MTSTTNTPTSWVTNAYWKDVTVTVSLVFVSLATVSYLLRLFAVKVSNRKLRLDDYLMGIGLFISFGGTGATIANAFNGVGVPGKELPPSERYALNLGSWLIQKFWPTSMAFIKISILLFLRRLFGARPVVRGCLDGLMVFVALWATAGLLTNIFQCWPVSYYYDKNQSGHCMKGQVQFFMAMGSLALIEDVVILLIPLPTIWYLQAKLRQKIAVTFILSLGSLVCICSLLRIVEFRKFVLSDLSSSSALESIFTVLEMNVAVICGCLPHLRPLFKGVLGISSAGQSYGNAGSSNQPHFDSSYYPASSRSGHNRFVKLDDSRRDTARPDQKGMTVTGQGRSSSEIELNGIEWTRSSDPRTPHDQHHAVSD